MTRRIAFIGAFFAAMKAKAAITLVKGVQLFVPAVTANALNIIRPGGDTVIADIGPTLRTDQFTNPTRLELNVDWGKMPPVNGGGGFTIIPRQLTLTDGNKYVFDPVNALPLKHLLFVNGLLFFGADDYAVSGGTIIAAHPAMLDPTAKVVIAV